MRERPEVRPANVLQMFISTWTTIIQELAYIYIYIYIYIHILWIVISTLESKSAMCVYMCIYIYIYLCAGPCDLPLLLSDDLKDACKDGSLTAESFLLPALHDRASKEATRQRRAAASLRTKNLKTKIR